LLASVASVVVASVDNNVDLTVAFVVVSKRNERVVSKRSERVVGKRSERVVSKRSVRVIM